MPKELLPIVDKPLIQYAVEEAYEAGIREMIFITGRYKRAIEDHFDKSLELERELIQKGKKELLESVRRITPCDVSFVFIRQPEPLGLGHAILCSQPVIGDEPFAVLLADDLIDSDSSAIGQLMQVRNDVGGGNVLAVQDVAIEDTQKYGIVDVDNTNLGTCSVKGIIEKPRPDLAPSTLAVIGRYILEPTIFKELRTIPLGIGGELQLTDAIAAKLSSSPTYAHRYKGTRYDCGSKQGFLDATVALARIRGFTLF